jgi:ferrochelatase
MAERCDYQAQLLETCRLIAESLQHERWRLVFQSRSGPPTQAWLEPDICDYLSELKEAGTQDVIIAPVGFISDHMEILYDLDTEARALCEQINLNMVRAATVGTHPSFVQMIRELIMERTTPDTPRRFLGARGLVPDVCPANCCLIGTAARPITSEAGRAPVAQDARHR